MNNIILEHRNVTIIIYLWCLCKAKDLFYKTLKWFNNNYIKKCKILTFLQTYQQQQQQR